MTPARRNTSPGTAGTPGGEDTRNPGLELFFDLVFVLCVAQLADKLHAHPTWTAAAGVIFLFVPVWWAWTGMTFAINRFPGDNVTVTVLVLAAAAARPAFGFYEPYLKILRIYQVLFRSHNGSRWLLHILTRVRRPAPSAAAGSR